MSFSFARCFLKQISRLSTYFFLQIFTRPSNSVGPGTLKVAMQLRTMQYVIKHNIMQYFIYLSCELLLYCSVLYLLVGRCADYSCQSLVRRDGVLGGNTGVCTSQPRAIECHPMQLCGPGFAIQYAVHMCLYRPCNTGVCASQSCAMVHVEI